ncbi:extracellular solute-binding protein [Deinococcus sp. Arct2-2]|uniref:sugar ABC transporter substrate-binding protein n=1 Tax=Deinococcus sp. Arct2-2 TaxID=2568653 RepID=UPI0010A2EB18|nr:extracellular solute-binding protein [Deinococcus sp. Arct2-2]THF66749.1 extracellular solute-binding protein [Deinococcus sp. Arct2-2]
MKRVAHLITLGLLISFGAASAQTNISMWHHQAGEPEQSVFKAQVVAFNASQTRHRVVEQNIPQGSYTTAVTSAALSKTLPCLVDMDQPDLPNYAWAGYLQPLNLPASVTAGLLPTALGKYNGKVYAVSQIDQALALYARRSALQQAGVRIPTVTRPWNKTEFEGVLAKLSKLGGKYKYAIDLRNFDKGADWWGYGYSPMLQSFGADLINRRDFQSAQGVLNNDKAVQFGEWFQSLFTKGYAEKNPAGPAFPAGTVPLAYEGSWAAADWKKTWGNDLLILPPPDLGSGPKIGSGSWGFGISAACANPDGARAFITFLSAPRQVAQMSVATGAIPVSDAAAALTVNYKPGGQFRAFLDFARRYAVPRPPTPAWPTIKTNFQKAMSDIVNGANVEASLDNAVQSIDQNIKDNKGYK